MHGYGWVAPSLALFIVVLTSGCATQPKATAIALRPTSIVATPSTPTPSRPTPASTATPGLSRGLRVDGHVARGVNLGNALEAPVEGEWGMVIEDDYLALIADAGFDLVRVPIRWSAHASKDSPYTIDPAFFARIDHVIEMSLARDLITIINMHHYDELMTYAPNHEDRFLAMWEQISDRYADYGDNLYFELLNEPHGWFSDAKWNDLAARCIAVVRQSNPERKIVVGAANWNAYGNLYWLELPQDDNLMVTFHHYEPFAFTHQGASWVEGSRQWLGTTWEASGQLLKTMREDLDIAVAFAESRGWTLLMGEFGAYEQADMTSRIAWTRALRREAEARGIAWAYWEFGAGFGIQDREKEAWREDLLDALVK